MVTLLEMSWEVCNKVGGIYTVIKSKSAFAQALANHYYAVGPYFPKNHASEFVEESTPDSLKPVFAELQQQGITAHFGKWLTDVEVDTILLDYTSFAERKNDIKASLWDGFGIDTLYTSYFDIDETLIWATAAGKLVEAMSKVDKTIAHAHEWLAGAALLYCKMNNVDAATVFTTHATFLGRVLSGMGMNIYDPKFTFNADREEFRTSVYPKHQIEKASAHAADVFTTVSPITALEAEKFLEKKPDVLVLNGLNISKFPTFEEAAIRHSLYKSKIKEFMLYYFFPHYKFDVDNTLVYFLASRNEVHAKGIDIYINALSNLNKKLQNEKSDKTIVAFIWVPGAQTGVLPNLEEKRAVFDSVKDAINDRHDYLMQRLLTSVISKHTVCDEEYLLGQELLSEVHKSLLRFKSEGLPPLSTHSFADEGKEPILQLIQNAGLLNRAEDRVKIIYYPVYLTGTDGLLDLTYYEALQGSHFGVFPSFYEPWGYTPVEAGAMGVSTITTDLSGFGRYIAKDVKGKKAPGIFVIPRYERDDKIVARDLTNVMYKFTKLSKDDRIKNKMEAKRIAETTDWQYMIKFYKEAYVRAAQKRGW